MHEVDAVTNFALKYKGNNWTITSIDGYRYKDTGEWLYSIHMRNINWQHHPGDQETKIIVTKEHGSFLARPAEKHRFHLRKLKPFWKIAKQSREQ